ncbi:MAG: restriction endonuclease, partial [Leptospiraceae bacterium]|nr:restriction endonuclease [Leptospiraceae bacterium]
ILQASPMFFEMLVLDLMQSLGYGAGPDDIEHVGGVRDGGIDGIISLDKLGFDKVCIQAKRWQGPVGRPDVQAFYGALAGRKTVKGVMLTTSSFTREAIEFADQMGNIVLIDGKLLAALMIDHGVGVGFQKAIKIPRLDEDYFNND